MILEKKQQSLQKILSQIVGVKKCYYSPPDGTNMEYPCIVYDVENEKTQHADNIKYLSPLRWRLTLIDRDPTSEILDEIRKIPYCSFDRHFTSGNLNHFVFALFF